MSWDNPANNKFFHDLIHEYNLNDGFEIEPGEEEWVINMDGSKTFVVDIHHPYQ
tara:strand:+ start:291 stop:452 length:162 start_codon:yes stop_codon:yes gene_type:complete